MLKTVSSIVNAIGALNYKGTWDASTNTPALASGVGTKGDYYVVSTAGTTTLDGISTWYVGDWATFNGSVWQRVEGGVDDPAPSLKSNSTTGLMQIAGPAAGQTRVVTIPDANATMARTDAPQTFTGDQTVATGNVIISDVTKGVQLARGGLIAAGMDIGVSETKTVTIAMAGPGPYAATIFAGMNVYGGGGNAIAQFMVGGDVQFNNAASAAVVGPTNTGNCVISGLTIVSGSVSFTMQNTNPSVTGKITVGVAYSNSDGGVASITIT